MEDVDGMLSKTVNGQQYGEILQYWADFTFPD